MYYAKYNNGSIYRAGMDVSSPSSLVTGLSRPYHIAIDFQNSRLYWTCEGDSTVQSSTMDGAEIRTIAKRSSASKTFGIGLSRGNLYWTNYGTRTLESSTMTGQDIQILHASESNLRRLTVVPRLDLPRNRSNDCAGLTCSKICVLSPSSFNCLT